MEDAIPYGDSIDLLQLTGVTIKKVLEQSVTDFDPSSDFSYGFLQISGKHITLFSSSFGKEIYLLIQRRIQGGGVETGAPPPKKKKKKKKKLINYIL